ncbi:MAG: 3-deoxy-7-phosphoheptulonate synthase [Candidatus Bathyarchaeia archaeon]
MVYEGISDSLKLALRDEGPNTIVEVMDVDIGGDRVVVIAGPCSVESREQLMDTARYVKRSGAALLRGGAFKPRTLPYSFQGLGEEGLKILSKARDETGLPIITEVMSPEDVELVESYADILQIGARNMQNYPLLKSVGNSRRPVMLKRGLAATINEWLGAAEYILREGNRRVILCERGIRTFQQTTRFTLDLASVPLLKQVTHLPVIVDPSHGTGRRSLVAPMSKAAIAAGADGVMVEVHPNPEEALSDGPQSLRFEEFKTLMESISPIVKATGKRL